MSAWVCRAAGTGVAAFCLPGWHSTWEPVMFLLSLLLLHWHLFVHWWPELRSGCRQKLLSCGTERPMWNWVGTLKSQTWQLLAPKLAGVRMLLVEPPAWQELLAHAHTPAASRLLWCRAGGINGLDTCWQLLCRCWLTQCHQPSVPDEGQSWAVCLGAAQLRTTLSKDLLVPLAYQIKSFLFWWIRSKSCPCLSSFCSHRASVCVFKTRHPNSLVARWEPCWRVQQVLGTMQRWASPGCSDMDGSIC